MKSSPGLSFVNSFGGTRESAQPIIK